MQSRTAAPRSGLTEAQVDAVVTGDGVTIASGCELLTDSGWVDISEDLLGGSVEFDNRNDVNGSCRLDLFRSVAWGRDRVRPYMILSDAAVSARFNLGVYVLLQPDEKRGETPVLFSAQGSDLLSQMLHGPVDTHVFSPVDNPGITYGEAVQAIVAASGVGAPLLLDGTSTATPIPSTKVWALISPAPSYLRILTDLLAEIGYVAPYMDPDGNICSEPYQDPAVRRSQWLFDTRDPATNLVHEDRTVSIDTEGVANAWRFVMANATITPTIANGLIYEPPVNQSTGPNSIDAVGEKKKFLPIDAADAAALAAAGDKVRAEDMAAVTTYSLTVDPMPLLWAHDVVTFTDVGDPVKVPVASWAINLDGTGARVDLGGPPAIAPEPVQVQAKATVTDDAPLSVVVDGADTPSFANALDAATYSIGDRVSVLVRNPQPPLVQGVES